MSPDPSNYLELDEGAGARTARRLLLHAAEQGFFSYALLHKNEWESVLLKHGAAQEEGEAGRESFRGLNGTKSGGAAAIEELRSRYGLDSAGTMLVVALRYAPKVEAEMKKAEANEHGEPQHFRLPAPIPDKPIVRVGRFAQGDWYREVLDRLAVCARETANYLVEEGLPRIPLKRWHRFANSRFPEKALAVAAGLGTLGRNSLLIAERSNPIGTELVSSSTTIPRWSSAVVLGIMLLPFEVRTALRSVPKPPRAPLELCAACTRCIEACPSNALLSAAVPTFVRQNCIQHYSSIDGPLPENIFDAWNDQLYGCDICLEACPHFIADPSARVRRGAIGGSFDAAALAEMDDEALHQALKGSALDQKWISIAALKRNASIVASRSHS